MTTSKPVVTLRPLRAVCACVALTFGASGFTSANADEFEVITVSAPKAKLIAHGPGATTATQQITVSARVQYDPVTLTTNSGVALLKDGVEEAARRVCRAADPVAPVDTQCIRNATDSAQPQIDAAVARARKGDHG